MPLFQAGQPALPSLTPPADYCPPLPLPPVLNHFPSPSGCRTFCVCLTTSSPPAFSFPSSRELQRKVHLSPCPLLLNHIHPPLFPLRELQRKVQELEALLPGGSRAAAGAAAEEAAELLEARCKVLQAACGRKDALVKELRVRLEQVGAK